MDPLDPSNMDALLPAAWAARRARVSRQLLYDWVKRGLLKPAGEGADGRSLYRVREVLAVELATRRSGRSTRRLNLSALEAELARLRRGA